VAGRRTGPASIGFFVLLGGATVIGPASMDIYLPGLPVLAQDFHVSAAEAQMTVTTFLIGLAVGQFVAGPLSDARGRKRPLVGGTIAYTLSSILCALAPNIYALGAFRFVEGASAAGGMAIARAIVRDTRSGVAAARYFSRLLLIVGLAPVLAPLIGGQILRVTSWRGVFFVVTALGAALTVAVVGYLPETLPEERRVATGARSMGRAFCSLLSDRAFVGLALVCGFGGGAVVAYVAGSSFVLERGYGISPQAYGIFFGLNALFLVGGSQLNAHLLKTVPGRALLRLGLFAFAAAGALLFVAVPLHELGIALVIPPLMLLMFSWGFVQSNAIGFALTDHPSVAGTAAAILGASQ
jgi:DHA1 family bicyclomycin/chloramphenicol resistance-like MFS transporter